MSKEFFTLKSELYSLKQELKQLNEFGSLIPSLKKAFNYVFPKEGAVSDSILQNRWLQKLIRLGPYVTFVAILGLFLLAYGFYGISKDDEGGLIDLYPSLTAIILTICIGYVSFIAVLAWIAKKKQRNLSILWAIMPLYPLKQFVIFLVLGLVLYFPLRCLFGPVALSRFMIETHQRENKEEFYPQDVFFGFKLGMDSYEDVITTLKNSQTIFTESQYASVNHKILIIRTKNYFPVQKLVSKNGKEVELKLEFDGEKRLYLMEITSTHLKTDELQNLFYHKYEKLMKQAWVKYWSRTSMIDKIGFYTPYGELIEIEESKLSFIFLPKMKSMRILEDDIWKEKKLEKAKRDSYLID